MSAEFLYLFLLHFPLVHQIRFITNQKENSILLCVGLDLVHPKLADVFKAKGVSEIEYEKNSLTSSVVGTCYGSKPLLACSVPNLKFYIFAINLYGLEPEIYSDSSQVVL